MGERERRERERKRVRGETGKERGERGKERGREWIFDAKTDPFIQTRRKGTSVVDCEN